MTETATESKWVQLLRGGILLAVLIAVPGTAVCWNMLPKEIFREPEKPPARKALETESNREEPTEDIPPPSFLPESDRKKDRFAFSDSGENTPEPVPLPRPSVPLSDVDPIRRMDLRSGDDTVVAPIPTTFPAEFSASPISSVAASSEWTHELNEPQSMTAPAASQRGFAELEAEIQRLGARHTRFEEWGDGGGLYRFSCYVSSSQPYRYQKHFQEIGADPLRVMEAVLEKIRAWQNQSGAAGVGSL